MPRTPFCRLGPLTAALLALTGLAAASDLQFSNQTTASGLTVVHNPSYSDSFLAGGAIGDFDRDGWQDVFVPGGGGQPDRLFINDQDGTFTDRANEWGIATSQQSTTAAVGDYDGDGWVDLFVASFTGNRLYRNDAGAGFTNVIGSSGIGTISPYGGAFGDYDLDGDLDLAIVSWNTASQNRLYRNEGDGTFTNVTASSGVASALGSITGFTVRFVDMNGDRYPELLWVGDFGTSEYLINDGDGTFTNGTAAAGVGFDGTEMGHTVADFNRDGLFDWYVTTISTNNLYMNLGDHQYSEQSAIAGVAYTGWGWATVGIDFDHDLRVDIAATSQSSGQFLYRNDLTGTSSTPTFSLLSSVGFSSGVSGRGLANFDYDNDGDQDLIVFPHEGPIQLFRNDLSGADTHWLRLFLQPGAASDIPPHGVGTVIAVTAGGVTQFGRIDAGNNYLSQSEMSAHFGLGSFDTIHELRLEWPNGEVTTFQDVEADRTLTVTYGQPLSPLFRRGDANADGAVDIGDAIATLGILFDGESSTCADAADSNDDGAVDISDAITALAFLFSSAPLPDPGRSCGVDPTADSLTCERFVACP